MLQLDLDRCAIEDSLGNTLNDGPEIFHTNLLSFTEGMALFR